MPSSGEGHAIACDERETPGCHVRQEDAAWCHHFTLIPDNGCDCGVVGPRVVATAGPAHLDCHAGVAHQRADCPGFRDAISTATACDGPMHGFVWCHECGTRPFEAA